jgi:hypothetical protein
MNRKVIAFSGVWELEEPDEDGHYYLFNMDADSGQYLSIEELVSLLELLDKQRTLLNKG